MNVDQIVELRCGTSSGRCNAKLCVVNLASGGGRGDPPAIHHVTQIMIQVEKIAIFKTSRGATNAKLKFEMRPPGPRTAEAKPSDAKIVVRMEMLRKVFAETGNEEGSGYGKDGAAWNSVKTKRVQEETTCAPEG